MDLAFDHADVHDVSDARSVLVAPPPVVTVLKMTSYCDNPSRRERDLDDIAHLLDAYVDDDSDRRFEEAVGRDFDLAPAYLLGRDIGQIARPDLHGELIDCFLDKVGDSESIHHALLREKGPTHWRSDREFLPRCLGAFRAGLDWA